MIRCAVRQDAGILAELALDLWGGHSVEEHQAEFSELLRREDAACFLACEGDTPVGFAQCQLRHDYVEGTTSSPVGYLEGIYVRPEFRHHSLGKELLAACEGWARGQGCREFASDCELENATSLKFHLRMGFSEANRIICFKKEL